MVAILEAQQICAVCDPDCRTKNPILAKMASCLEKTEGISHTGRPVVGCGKPEVANGSKTATVACDVF